MSSSLSKSSAQQLEACNFTNNGFLENERFLQLLLVFHASETLYQIYVSKTLTWLIFARSLFAWRFFSGVFLAIFCVDLFFRLEESEKFWGGKFLWKPRNRWKLISQKWIILRYMEISQKIISFFKQNIEYHKIWGFPSFELFT